MVVFFEDLFMKYFDVWDLDTDFSFELPFRGLNFSYESQEYRTLANEVRQFYFGDAAVSEKTILQYENMLDDAYFIYPNHVSIKANLERSMGKTYHVQ